MTNSSIHAALWEWLAGCASITKLFFNFGEASDGSTGIMTSGDTVLESYLDGSQLRRYAFDLVRFLPIGWDPNDAGNVTMMEDVDAIVEWMERQGDQANFPTFPSGCTVERVAVSDEGVGYADAQDDNRARYIVPIIVDYVRERQGRD